MGITPLQAQSMTKILNYFSMHFQSEFNVWSYKKLSRNVSLLKLIIPNGKFALQKAVPIKWQLSQPFYYDTKLKASTPLPHSVTMVILVRPQVMSAKNYALCLGMHLGVNF